MKNIRQSIAEIKTGGRRSGMLKTGAVVAASFLLAASLSCTAAAAPAYSSNYTNTFGYAYMIGPSMIKNTTAAGVYEQLRLALQYKVMSEGDILTLYTADNTTMPIEAIRLLNANGMVSGYLYKTLAGLPYTASDFSDVFDAQYYMNNNPVILQAVQAGALSADAESLFQNFLICGMPAGLRGNASFDPAAYIKNNSSLAAVYGSDNMQYYIHYILYGKTTGLTTK